MDRTDDILRRAVALSKRSNRRDLHDLSVSIARTLNEPELLDDPREASHQFVPHPMYPEMCSLCLHGETETKMHEI